MKFRRGMTLLEAMLALGVMAFGLVGLFGLIGNLQTANRTMAFQTAALDAFGRIQAQIADARCDVEAAHGTLATANIDPGIGNPLDSGAWQGAAVPQSVIQHVGDFTAAEGQVPPLRIDYEVRTEGAVGPATVPGIEIDVRIRELFNDPARDDVTLTDGYWIRIFPVKKLCATRATNAQARGEY